MGAGSIGPGWGNGKAIAVRLAQEGARVFAVDQNSDAAAETRALIEADGGECIAHRADATVAEQVRGAVDACMDSLGAIDILVNNIGIGEAGGVVETSEESWDRVFEVNLKTMFLACKFAVPQMQSQGGGSIVNISSLASIRWGGKKLLSYAASKAGMNQMTRVMAVEHAPDKIRVNVILPGLIATPMGLSAPGVTSGLAHEALEEGDPQTSFVPIGHLGSAWDVANAALYLASDEARYVTGIELLVDGGLATTLVARAD
jgi:NAD(P)-dependent dehydrogenase (short-subunit alcohol dehydrogenase family)